MSDDVGTRRARRAGQPFARTLTCGVFFFGVLVSALLVSAKPAAAQAASQPDPQESAAEKIREDAKAERESRGSSGWYIVAVDVPAVLVMDLSLALGARANGGSVDLPGSAAAPFGFGATAYVLAAPIVHWLQEGGPGSATQWASAGLHVAGFLVGSSLELGLLQGSNSCGSPSTATGCTLSPALAATVGGLIFAVPTVLDALVLKTHRKHSWGGDVAWAPTLQVRSGGAVAGLGGAF